MSKPKASRDEFDRLVRVLEAVPFNGSGATVHEIHSRLQDSYGVETLMGILSTQVHRGWIMSRGRATDRRYLRVIYDVRATLTELVTIV
jgi:hypothetical protein